MKIKDITKFQWEKGGEWFEKWYGTEQCFLAFYSNPLTKSFMTQGLNSIACNTQWFYEVGKAKEWDEAEKAITRYELVFYKNLIKEARKYIKKSETLFKEISSLTEVDITTFELVKKTLISLWYVFLADIGQYLGSAIEDLLKSENLTKEQIEYVKNYYLTTHKQLAYQEEQKSLEGIFNILNKKFKDINKMTVAQLPEDIVALLENHKNQFSWLSTSDIDTEPSTIQNYLKRLQEFDQIKGKLNQIKLNSKLKISIQKDKLLILEAFNKLLYIDNYCADVYQEIDFLFQLLISKKHKISFRDLSWYTWSELEALVKEGTQISGQELAIRKQFRVMVQINGKIETFYGKENFKKIRSLLVLGDTKAVKIFKGTKASLGCVQGIARVVMGIKDINKVKDGDIIVANTTRPDLMPALLRCIAIVTDHGGVTSHAAIVSRELKIPCIVGTVIATEVIKDGNLIEVDADQGIVKILE